MCCGKKVYKILFSAVISDLFPDPSSDHNFSQLLYLSGGEEHVTRDHLPPPVAHTGRLCHHVGPVSGTTPTREIIHRQN